MRRALWAALFLVMFGCASAGPVKHGACGGREPVYVLADSNHFNDVVIRDSEGRRLGLAYGLSQSAFAFCLIDGTTAVFALDPIGESESAIVDAGGALLEPGDAVRITIGSALSISFASLLR